MGKNKEAAFGAGCFWGVEGEFMKIKGVEETEAGYMGGKTENPNYDEVCTGKTGHAETVHLKYDPDEVSYGELLDAFWGMHNPTTPNRQGLDMGSQYRSVIFYYSEEQKKQAEKSKQEQQEKLGGRKIVTEIVPAGRFWRAEEYHQKYKQKNKGKFF
ncbi:peptide-methionine (S)-S-oxide reductase MsrA [Candidatus Micrarchaeota archaeon]|nr:peptide-methionine (S)-S-oxide reductase MsrA [Candidatus Micrarchaeota archaeon]MBD3418311.1 peptide-methionine (S)-S-oxide reductase MsrA [Candidatus Micrarchaeota archaeon]